METKPARKSLRIEPATARAVEIGRTLGMLEDARRRTLAMVNGLSQAELDGPPRCGTNTIAALLYHIAAIELSWLYDVLGTPFPPDLEVLFPLDVRDETGQLSRIAGRPLQEHLDRLAKVRSALLAAYAIMDIEEYRRPRELDEYDLTPEWVLHHLMQHEAEHRGQISPGG